MIRSRKNIDWAKVLPPEDLAYTRGLIQPDEWYPMETFERLGDAILSHVPGATLESVRLWGRYSANVYANEHPDLVVQGDPVDSMMRLKVLRSTLFDYPAFDMPVLTEGLAHVTIDYQMGPTAEEAACWQTLGFCEGVLSLSGTERIEGRFEQRRWEGHPRTLAVLEWGGD